MGVVVTIDGREISPAECAPDQPYRLMEARARAAELSRDGYWLANVALYEENVRLRERLREMSKRLSDVVDDIV